MKRGITHEGEIGGEAGAFEIFRRALRYAAPLKGRFVVKGALIVFAFIPQLVIMPFLVKLIVDQVVRGMPLAPALGGYPTLLRPVLGLLVDASPLEILGWAIAGLSLMLVTIGQFGSEGGERDRAEGYLASGVDTATNTEDQANSGWSFVGGLMGLFDFTWTIRLSQALNHHYRTQLFERIQHLPMHYFDDERIGDGVYRLMYDTPSITEACYRTILTPMTVPFLIMGASWQLWDVYPNHPAIYWGAFALFPLSLVVTLPFTRVFRRQGGRSRQSGATTTSTLEEGVSNIVAVQSLGAEKGQAGQFASDSWQSFVQFRRLIAVGMTIAVVAALPVFAVVGLIWVYVTELVIANTLTPGDFSVILIYAGQLIFLAVTLGALWIRLQTAAPGLHRVFFLMDLPSEQDEPGALPLAPIRESMRVEAVDFEYPDGTPALRGIDLEVRVGQMTALVGAAGAGKTTLAYLFPRFLSPTRGRVLADGVDLAGVTRASLRDQIAFVFQEQVLFDGTVEENIRMGNLEASELQIREAARIAGADEFIRQLPQGFQTPLGRAGGRLSVGQKQRLTIARALVRDARVLVFDEPTSALDPLTETKLVDALEVAARDRIVIVIAHRLSTVRRADQVAVLADGRIVEQGAPADLLARPDGLYRRLVELQASA